MTFTVHLWMLVPFTFACCGLVAFARMEPMGGGWWDFPDIWHGGIGVACWLAALAFIGGHFL